MVKKTFDEVVLLARTGLNPRDNFKLGNGSNKYITIKNIHNNEIIIDENTDVVDDAAIELIHKRSQIKKGDILFCSIGRMGDMYIIPDEPQGWDINESVFAFTVDTKLVRQKYFYYVFKNRDTIEYLSKNSSGSTFKSIKMNQLKKMVFDLPSLDEQDAIVGILDRLCDIIQKRKQELDRLDDLIKARFVELFGNGNHKIVKAAEVCDFITKGTTPPTGEICEEYGEEMVPFLKVYNLSFTGEMLFDDNPQYIPKETHNGKLARSKVYPNDVLMNIVGPPLGKFTIVTNEFEEWNINQAIAIFRAKERILPRFLLHALMQPTVLEPFIGQAVGIRQQNLSLEQCRNLRFPLPSIEEQRSFVEFAEQLDKSKFVVQKTLDETRILFDSLMQKYFG